MGQSEESVLRRPSETSVPPVMSVNAVSPRAATSARASLKFQRRRTG